MKNLLFSLLALLLVLASSASLLAQGPPPATPIDGGIGILLAAGGIYGLKKIKDSTK